jgi:argininosuccinate synthase
MWTRTLDPMKAPDAPTDFTIYFEQGLPVKVVSPEKTVTDSLELFKHLNSVGFANGVGRIDIVEVRPILKNALESLANYRFRTDSCTQFIRINNGDCANFGV